MIRFPVVPVPFKGLLKTELDWIIQVKFSLQPLPGKPSWLWKEEEDGAKSFISIGTGYQIAENGKVTSCEPCFPDGMTPQDHLLVIIYSKVGGSGHASLLHYHNNKLGIFDANYRVPSSEYPLRDGHKEMSKRILQLVPLKVDEVKEFQFWRGSNRMNDCCGHVLFAVHRIIEESLNAWSYKFQPPPDWKSDRVWKLIHRWEDEAREGTRRVKEEKVVEKWLRDLCW